MPSAGQGSLSISPKVDIPAPPGPPGPPFQLTSANSGLHVDLVSGKIQLGSNGVNPLLQNTDVNLAGFTFDLNDAGQKLFFVDPANFLIQAGDINGANNNTLLQLDDSSQTMRFQKGLQVKLNLDVSGNTYSMGDLSAANNRTSIYISDVTTQLFLLSQFQILFNNPVTSNRFLQWDMPAQLYQMGDLDFTNNAMVFEIDDNNAVIRARQVTDDLFSLDPVNELFEMGSIDTTNKKISIDGTNEFYQFGNIGTQTRYFINGMIPKAAVEIGGNQFLNLDQSISLYQIGDIDSVLSNSVLSIADNLQRMEFSVGPNRFLSLDNGAGIYQIGDIDIIGGGNSVVVNDSSGRIYTTTFDEIIGTTSPYSDASGALIGTLTNSPLAGNPTKWIRINDAGTVRRIPAW